MRLKKSSQIFVLCLFLVFLGIAGCNSSSSDDAAAPSASQLSTYEEDVIECTPYLAVSGEGYFDEWATGWSPETEFSVLYKLFHPDSGVEGIYDPIESLDEYIEIINEISEKWDEEEDFTANNGQETVNVSINNTVSSITVPFWGNVVSIDRVITMENDTCTCNVGFTIGEGEERCVAHYVHANGETGVYYAHRNSTAGDIEIWSACYAPDDADPFYGAFKWKGNPDAGTFAITQYTNSASGSNVMGGGDIDGNMSFIAKRGDTDPSNAEYYITLDIDDIEGDNPIDPGTITAAGVTAPDPDAYPSHAYITSGNASCLGYLTSYPSTAASLAWTLGD